MLSSLPSHTLWGTKIRTFFFNCHISLLLLYLANLYYSTILNSSDTFSGKSFLSFLINYELSTSRLQGGFFLSKTFLKCPGQMNELPCPITSRAMLQKKIIFLVFLVVERRVNVNLWVILFS